LSFKSLTLEIAAASMITTRWCWWIGRVEEDNRKIALPVHRLSTPMWATRLTDPYGSIERAPFECKRSDHKSMAAMDCLAAM